MRCAVDFCRGPLMFLGQLGILRWFRCRDCGMDQSQKTKTRKRGGVEEE